MPRLRRQREAVITVPLEELAAAYAGFGDAIEEFAVAVQAHMAAEYLKKAVAITPVASGTMRASWDPSIDRARNTTGRPGEIPTARQALRVFRRLRPGQDALVSNAARATGQSEPYAELIWKAIGKHASKLLPRGGQSEVEEHLRRQFPEIVRRAERDYRQGGES